MIKNKKEKKINPELVSSIKKKRGSIFIEQQFNQIGQKEDPMKLIEKLPTYTKISILQGLLKEMTSIKERFEDNKKDLLEKIKNNCYEFYKSKIGMKEIYDYCLSNYTDNHNNYKLIENTKDILNENYDTIYQIIFLLRNNNDLMLNIIKNCPENSYDQLTDFIVNFFYENAIDSSFNEEELMVIIYLIIEENILDKFPKSIFNINLKENKNDNYLEDNILYHIFRSLTRKPDVRNFTVSVLSESILKLEGYNDILSIETKIISSHTLKDKNSQINQCYTYNNKKAEKSLSFDDGSSALSLEYSKTLSSSNPSICEEILNLEDEKMNLENIELDPCFSEDDVTLEYLNEKLSEYSQKNSKDNINIAMKQYINNLISQLNIENAEIFSNNKKIKTLKIYKALNNKDNSDILTEILIKNYNKLTNFIDEILSKLKENINSMPYILKSINNIIDILLNKKYSKENEKNFEFQKNLILSNFLIGNIILPLISNPDFNGIITTCVISKITKDNLEIIAKIFKKILSGKLFTNKNDSEYTIFNKYIIDTLPKIFDIIKSLNLQKNFKLSKIIQKLINSSDSIGNPNRDINYNYFKENQENIQQQSICFSWVDLVILINSFKLYNDSNNNDEKIKNNEKLINDFINMRDYCVDKYNDNLTNYEKEFFIFEKINYSNYFNKQMQNILEDNYLALMPNKDKDDDNILLFKKCLVEVLTYVNKLHKESFNYFVQKNQENIIQDNDIILLLLNQELYKKYMETKFEEEKIDNTNNNNDYDAFKKFEKKKIVHLKGLEENENEDANFREVIFPQIIDSIKYELGHNLDSIKTKRIVFCSSYLQIHIDDLPKKYKENNYCLLIMEIIRKHESIINELNFSIINQFYLKVKAGQKLNMIITNNYLQIKEMEKCICIEYLFDKLDLPCKLSIRKDGMGKISSIKYEAISGEISYIHTIQSFIDIFPDLRKYSDKVDDIIDLEEKIELDVALNAYFKDLRALVKKEKIITRFTPEEFESITTELENYILFKLYDKLFPAESTLTDKKFYKKCCRLDFVKPENLIKDKKMINEKLWEASMVLIDEMDEKLTPADKVKNFGKAFGILQNSITFCSGKNDLGIDDTISTLIYVILKSKPKNIFSNSKYCQLFLNPELAKKQYGILLSQIEMIKNIIYEMKYSDLIGITEEQFGKDEE